MKSFTGNNMPRCLMLSARVLSTVLLGIYVTVDCALQRERRLYTTKYSGTSNNGHCRRISILSVIGGVR
jgi:hypothetical protein